MRIAVISDIHGNLEALTAVFRDIESHQVEAIHCLGDVIGYGCDPRACLHLVEENCDIKLVGNHEYMLMGKSSVEQCNPSAQESFKWTQLELNDYDMALIEKYEIQRVRDDVFFVHASTYKPEEWHYIVNREQAGRAFNHLDQSVCFFGHSHLPTIFLEMPDELPRIKIGHDFLMDADQRYLINVGSVGQPRDNDPRASYVVADTDTGDVYFNRVEYDVKTTQDKMVRARLPKILIERLSVGR